MSDPEAETERMPWCPECEAFAVPTAEGTCGVCGGDGRLPGGRPMTSGSEPIEVGDCDRHGTVLVSKKTGDCILCRGEVDE